MLPASVGIAVAFLLREPLGFPWNLLLAIAVATLGVWLVLFLRAFMENRRRRGERPPRP